MQLERVQSAPFTEALRRMWVQHPSGTARHVFAAVGCLLVLVLQVAMVVLADHPWGWIAVPVLPAAAWFVLAGWVHQRSSWRVLGLLLLVLGAFVPFYLT